MDSSKRMFDLVNNSPVEKNIYQHYSFESRHMIEHFIWLIDSSFKVERSIQALHSKTKLRLNLSVTEFIKEKSSQTSKWEDSR